MSSKVFRSLTREDEKHGGRVELCTLKKREWRESNEKKLRKRLVFDVVLERSAVEAKFINRENTRVATMNHSTESRDD